MARRNRGNDEKTVFFAAKIVFPILVGLVVAAGMDIASARKGTVSFVKEAKAACVSCHGPY